MTPFDDYLGLSFHPCSPDVRVGDKLSGLSAHGGGET